MVAKGTTLGWGIGFYQSGEVLLRRRPIDERAEIDVAAFAKDLRADVLIGHVRAATVGNLRTENTHPFRYRQWLFAHTGTIDGYPTLKSRVSESLPEFLRRNVRGDTDSELLFHLFLSFFTTRATWAAVPSIPAPRAALRATSSLIQRLHAEEGAGDNGDEPPRHRWRTHGGGPQPSDHGLPRHQGAHRILERLWATTRCGASASPTWLPAASASGVRLRRRTPRVDDGPAPVRS